ncbi:MAG: polysaccharide biosynthesis protein [Candidatus Aminicenantes bacterium]|nr:polysaccharide biosynthesis protein [Candidatus Aminicenantes bacterium]
MKKTSLEETFRDKRILVTGGTGSIGSELVKKLLQCNPKVIRVFSNDENAQFELEQELQEYSERLRFLVGDVRDKERLKRATENIEIVFHVAALKHVPLCEYNPFEAIKTNVNGTQNLLEVAIDENVEKVITISTDKAVNPANVMGATKLLAERLTIAANYYRGLRRTVFSCVRFGNVLASRGSVVQLFEKQIKNGGPVTLTDPNMVRFVMNIDRATELVIKAAQMARGEEIFIFKMPALQIRQLAEVMIQKLAPKYGYEPKNIEIKIIGKRRGEKLYEELMAEDEAMNVYETKDMLMVLPQTPQTVPIPREGFKKVPFRSYTSKDTTVLAKREIEELLESILK